MKILFTFPGQGAQYPGMLQRLPDNGKVRLLLEEAADSLGEGCLSLDTAESLEETRSVQLCLLLSGVIHARHLIDAGVMPDMVLGLSVGAFPAAVVSGVLAFADAMKIVALRGSLMQQAFPSGYGMTALSGLDRWAMAELVRAVHSAERPVFLANINTDRQVVISGEDSAMRQVAKIAARQGATNVTRIAISVPSHCGLLDAAAEKLAIAMKSYRFREPAIPYLSGSSGRICRRGEEVMEDLAFNMARTVRWHEAVTAAWERGARLAVEMPPGNVLTGLTRPVFAEGEAVALQDTKCETVCALAKARHSRA